MKLTAAFRKVGDWWAAWLEEIPRVKHSGCNFRRGSRKLEGRAPRDLPVARGSTALLTPNEVVRWALLAWLMPLWSEIAGRIRFRDRLIELS